MSSEKLPTLFEPLQVEHAYFVHTYIVRYNTVSSYDIFERALVTLFEEKQSAANEMGLKS